MISTTGKIKVAVTAKGARSIVPKATTISCGTSQQRGNIPEPRCVEEGTYPRVNIGIWMGEATWQCKD